MLFGYLGVLGIPVITYILTIFNDSWVRPSQIWFLVGLSAVLYATSLRVFRIQHGNSIIRSYASLRGAIFSVVSVYLLCFSILLLTRGYYSRRFLLASFLLTQLWLVVYWYLCSRNTGLTLLALPGTSPDLLDEMHGADVTPIARVDEIDPKDRYDAILVDFHSEFTTEWKEFLARAALKRVPILHTSAAFESLTGRVPLNEAAEQLVGTGGDSERPTKRFLDLLLILLTLPIVLPLLAIAALAVRLDSPGPVIFTQSRVGQGGRRFTMYKLRTMHADAGPDTDDAQFAADNDPRCTRVGQLLRKFRIDEIPQFYNVLKGDMSLIGPRPEQVCFVELFKTQIAYYDLRHLAKPGITGWAQVNSGYAHCTQSSRVKLEYDLFYVKYGSLFLDLYIVWRTLGTVLTGFGAR